MIELYISTNISENFTAKKITEILCKKGVECLIMENFSSCKKLLTCEENLNDLQVENGYIIKIFNLQPLIFKEKVWEVLKKKLKLKCAFIKYEDYMGCILNWPNVFTKSNCSSFRSSK